jgi:hypothetical protein
MRTIAAPATGCHGLVFDVAIAYGQVNPTIAVLQAKVGPSSTV